MKKIPLIIPVYNQLTYLKNLINWWRWYHPENPIYVMDNGSTYQPLLDYLDDPGHEINHVMHYDDNTFIPNLTSFIEYARRHGMIDDYYVISDPDMMPHPNTPMNFLEVWRGMIENHGFHRAGFNLIINDLPEYLHEREMTIGNEKELIAGKEIVKYGNFQGYKAPIDTTFCLYSVKNGGWQAPMDGKNWGNSLRLFDAFHLGWYVDGENLNPEMKQYFESSKYRVPGEPSAGKNNFRPKQFQ